MEKALILLGPTAVGKTAVSLLLARALGTEIISADSMQIYRHMDIGTAKPTPEERRAVRHHLIDVAEPWEHYSAGEYIAAAAPVLEQLCREGRPPLIVGGTGLYIKAMTRGLFSGPSADRELREGLLLREQEEPGALYALLRELDPDAAEAILPQDTRRTVRAVEVCLKSSRKLSELRRELTRPLPYEFIKIGLTRDRRELYPMIERRVDAMMAQGLLGEVEEVIRLIQGHDPLRDPASYPSMQAIGYKELALHLSGRMSLDEAVALIKKRSRNYAKRQFTWFRKEEGIAWVDVTGLYDAGEIVEKVRGLIKTD